MDLINPSPSLPLPKTMWLVLRAKALGDDLSLVAPDELQAPSASGHVKAAERALDDLGILGLPAERLHEARKSYSEFVDALRSAVLGEEEGDPSTLRAAIEWLMKQSPTTAVSSTNFESLDPDRVFQNPARWNGFTFWAAELGFAEYAWAVGQTEDALVANPMRAIGSVIQQLREPGPRPEAMPVRQFLDRLRAALLVFPTDGADAGTDPLGQAASWALIGAHAKAWLNLEMKADAPRVYLTDPDAPDGRRAVSHVTLRVGNGA